MQKENAADRALKERKLQEEKQKEAERLQKIQEAEKEEQRIANGLETEIPVVLKLLAQQNYPFSVEIHLEERIPAGLFGNRTRMREYIKAGWILGSYSETRSGVNDTTTTYRLYLFPDGHLCTGTDRYHYPDFLHYAQLPLWLPREAKAPLARLRALEGLQDLRNKLEGKKK